MRTRGLAAIAGTLFLACAAAQAESLRCQGGIASEGDSRLSLLHKCGPPQLSDAYCASVLYGTTLHPVPEPFAGAFVPCQRIEEWVYERGPGNLVATVRVRSGIVQSIAYGRTPQ